MDLAHKNRGGFTLVELILVMTIMTVLGLIAAYGISNAIVYARIKDTEATIRLMDIAIDQFKQDKGRYPTGTGTDVIRVLTDPSAGWSRASISDFFPRRKEVKDAWETDLAYTCYTEYESSGRGVERTPGMKDYYNPLGFQIYSMGPNMQTWLATGTNGHPRLGGTEPDDIRNWTQVKFYSTKAEAYP